MVHNFIDLTGKQFGHWTVLSIAGKDKRGNVIWNCRCSCGEEKQVDGRSLRGGASKSCGHGKKRGNPKHGSRYTKLYMVWVSMRGRCSNPHNKDYEYYGGRGITVCGEWDDYINFERWALSHGYSDGLSIDRINNDGNYEPSNCRWATAHEQRINQRKRRAK